MGAQISPEKCGTSAVLVAAAGIQAPPGRRAPRLHDLRHTFTVATSFRHGESVKTVQRRLGHATAAETLDTYVHLWPDSEDRTRAAIDAVLRPTTPTQGTPRPVAAPRTADRPRPSHGGPTLS